MLFLRNRVALGCLAVAGLVAVGTPAVAKTVFSWTTEDGVYAFTDDAKRIPAMYRAEVSRRKLRSVSGYERYTPTSRIDRAAVHERAPAHVDALRADESSASAVPAAGESVAGRTSLVLRTGRRDRAGVDIELSLDGKAEPIVIEEVRVRPDDGVGQNATRTVTMVRRGDAIIAVVRGQNNNRPTVELDEPDLMDYAREQASRDDF